MDKGEEKDKSQSESKPKTSKAFANAYQRLCDEFGFRVVVTPVWIARDDGSWSMVLQPSVGEMPKTNKPQIDK